MDVVKTTLITQFSFKFNLKGLTKAEATDMVANMQSDDNLATFGDAAEKGMKERLALGGGVFEDDDLEKLKPTAVAVSKEDFKVGITDRHSDRSRRLQGGL